MPITGANYSSFFGGANFLPCPKPSPEKDKLVLISTGLGGPSITLTELRAVVEQRQEEERGDMAALGIKLKTDREIQTDRIIRMLHQCMKLRAAIEQGSASK